MRRRLSIQDGFTLIEVLLVSTLFIVILSATLTVVTGFEQNTKRVEKTNDQAEMARNALDKMNRQLRNLARRIDQPVIARATADDFIFQTSDPTRTWVRWCLEPGTGQNGTARLWFSETPSAPSVSGSMGGACPGSGWTRTTVVADAIVNPTGARRVFSYVCLPTSGTCPLNAAQFPLIKNVTSQLFVDVDPARRPRELLVSSAVHLRNQNEVPTAMFTSRPSGITRRVILNGAASSDPEQRTLRFYWFTGTSAPSFNCVNGPPSSPPHLEGVTPVYTFPSSDGPAGTTVPFTLVVCDPGDLMSPPYTAGVQIPT